LFSGRGRKRRERRNVRDRRRRQYRNLRVIYLHRSAFKG